MRYNYKFEIERLVKKNNETLKRTVNLLNENEKLKQQIEGLTSENFELQNDLFTEQLNEDETDDYIDKLKNELFNGYLHQQHQERLISELKEALSSYNNFVDVMFPD